MGKWLQRIALLLFTAAAVYLLVTVILARREADPDHEFFESGEPVHLQLDAGEGKSVYLTAWESEPLNFDFYPSDLNCHMRSGGAPVDGTHIYDEKRFIDGWRIHWGVENFRAESSGWHTLVCRDRADRAYPLVLAKPSTYLGAQTPPGFALFLLVFAAVPLGVVLLVRGLLWWGASRESSTRLP